MKRAALFFRNHEFCGTNISLIAIYALKKHAEVDCFTVFDRKGLQGFYGIIAWIDSYSKMGAFRTYFQVQSDVDVYY